jgi:TPR repeat protein
MLKSLLVFVLFAAAGFAADTPTVAEWRKMAAEQGYASAQFLLGMMYAEGEGVPKDLVQAHVWLNIAGANGDKDAKKSLAIVEEQMTSEQKAEAMKLARELFAKLPKLPKGK